MISGLLTRDRGVRLCGSGLLVLATLLLAVVHPHATTRIGDGPTVTEFCLALIGVCTSSVGASFLFVGRALFEPVSDPRRRAVTDADMARGER